MSPTYRLALRAYPQQYRREHGPELVATANELSPDGWSARQATSLVIEGFRTRARRAAGPGGRSIWFDGAAFGLALWYLIGATAHLTNLLGIPGDIDQSPPAELSMVAAVAALGALTVTSRWPTAAAHTALSGLLVASFVLDDPRIRSVFLVQILGVHIALSAVAWWLALRGHGKRALSPTAAIALLCSCVAASWVADVPEGGIPALAAVVGLPVVGLVLVTIDPRPVIAGATVWVLIATTSMPLTLSAIEPLTVLRTAILAAGCTIWLFAGRLGVHRLVRN